MNRFAWANAGTISEAAKAASTTVADAMMTSFNVVELGRETIVKAGGIDLLDLLKEKLLAPSTIVNVRNVPGLDDVIEVEHGGMRLGAMVTLATLAMHPVVRRHYPAIGEAAQSSASPQIRNVATLGGNLLQRPRCWYFRSAEYHCLRKGGGHCFAISAENQYHAIFDNRLCAIVHPSTVATVLVALGATVEMADAEGMARRVLLEDFFMSPEQDFQRENALKPHEIVTGILLPSLSPSVRMAHLKQGEKDSFDWPLADVAVVLDLSPGNDCKSASIVLGAAAPVPYRAKAAERALAGERVDERLAARAARAAVDGATPLSKNAYKLPMFEALVRRAILKVAAHA